MRAAAEGGAAHVERWFLRVVLGVSVVAWLSLLLAEVGRFRLDLLGLILTTGALGLGLLVYAVRPGPAARSAGGGGGLKAALGEGWGSSCAARCSCRRTRRRWRAGTPPSI